MPTLDRRAFLGVAATRLLVGPPSVRATVSVGQGAAAGDLDVGRWRTRFPALQQSVNGHPLAYLDSAATTLRPRAVIDAITRYYETDNANPGAALHTLAARSASGLAAARSRVARFLGAADAAEVVFTRGTTEAINLVAATWGEATVKPGDEILVTAAEHYSNLLPWRRLADRAGARVVVVDVTDDGRVDPAHVREAFTARTKLLAFSHVSNVLGLVNPAEELCALARQRNVRVLVDAAQSAPHIRLDVRALDCDFLACSSHKMLGPMGVGVLWARAELLEDMPAYHVGSNMAHDVTETSFALEHGAAKFQAGTPNVSGPIGLATALDELDRIGMSAIARHDRDLVAYAREQLAPRRGVRVLGTLDAHVARAPVFTFTKDRVSPATLVAALDAAGVAVRAGDMATLPLLRRFGVESAVRASCYLYTTVEEIDRMISVVDRTQ